jgi:uncharacterized protein (DUF1015 family)
MAKIYPFRGVHYNEKIVGDLSKVVTQPYDQIKNDLMENYYARSPFNITRIIKGRKEPDLDENNVYTRAGDYLSEWMRDGVLVTDEKPALYVYYQEYQVDGEWRVRKGFIPLVELQEYGEGVKAHEKTLEAPKLDRFNLMLTTESNTELIFMLYSEPERIISKVLDDAISGRKPDIEATDDFGCIHKIWAVTDFGTIKKVQERMEPLTLFIADGHHRYETSVNYMNHLRAKGKKCDPGVNECYANCMMTLVNVDEPGLTVLPTHRLVHGVDENKMKNLVTEAMKYFNIEHFPLAQGDDAAMKQVLDAMKARMKDEHLYCLYVQGDNELKLLSLKDESVMNKMVTGVSEDWKKLDIAILHTVLLDKLLGIDAEKLAAKTNVDYMRSPYDTLKRAKDNPKYQCVFVVNPTGVEEVRKIAARGDKMPQKSTDFFPKLISGLVLNKMRIE